MKIFVLVIAGLFLVACEVETKTTADVPGIRKCKNKVTDADVSFDSKDAKGVVTASNAFLRVKDIRTNLTIDIKPKSGWVCVDPNGVVSSF